MEKCSFDLRHTNIVKGALVMAMVLHHVFGGELSYWTLSHVGNNEIPIWLTRIAHYGKVCVGVFCFLSAYGITRKLMQTDGNVKNIVITRFVKLYFAFWPIYIIGVIGTLLFGDMSLGEVYTSQVTNTFSWILPLLDVTGIAHFFDLNTLNTTWWYMAVAISSILITPIAYQAYCKYKSKFIILVLLFPYLVSISYKNNFLILIMLGVVFAKEDLLVKLKERVCRSRGSRIAGYALIVFFVYATYEFSTAATNLLAMPIATLACVICCYVILSDIPVLSGVLAFLGKHSANIYYIHTFLYLYWFSYSIYSLSNIALIYCAVFGGALLISLVLELGKKIVRYNKLEQRAITYLTRSNPK